MVKTYDPIEQFDEALAAVNAFLAGHRIDPYTEQEICDIMKPLPIEIKRKM